MIFFLLFFFLKINCEELVEGYDSPVAGITSPADNGEDDVEDEDITGDMGTSSKVKSKSSSFSSLSSKSMSILSRSISEYDTCARENSVDFDPIQGKK
jgi:hypothetical protein